MSAQVLGSVQFPTDDIDDKWDQILPDTDVLITHGPPLEQGDVTSTNDVLVAFY